MRIYMDVCCFNRPQDDLTILRNRLESEAVLSILQQVRIGRWQLIGSEVVDAELSMSPTPERKAKAMSLAALRSSSKVVGPPELSRGQELAFLGMGAVDALHTACAEADKCDVLLTTDDQFLARYRANQKTIMVPIANPLAWIAELDPA